jgi:hypothetical protein
MTSGDQMEPWRVRLATISSLLVGGPWCSCVARASERGVVSVVLAARSAWSSELSGERLSGERARRTQAAESRR